jgi:hypothetical protein
MKETFAEVMYIRKFLPLCNYFGECRFTTTVCSVIPLKKLIMNAKIYFIQNIF